VMKHSERRTCRRIYPGLAAETKGKGLRPRLVGASEDRAAMMLMTMMMRRFSREERED